jgi:uncharacterized protein (DUF2236 family)
MPLLPNAITLPAPLQQRLENAARSFIHPAHGPEIDFSMPAGEPALGAPDSLSWQIFKNPLSLFIGGVTAVVLELAEPRVRTGVWEHTSFRHDPRARLQRTGLAAMVTVYGARSQAEAMIARVARMHGNIRGLTPAGQPYRADDPELLDWVHATASFGFLEAYNAYVRPLANSDCDRFYAEAKSSARLYGSFGAPLSQADFGALCERMRGKLEPSNIVFEFLEIMRRAPLLPTPLGVSQHLLVDAALALLPEWLQERLELRGRMRLRTWQRELVRRCGAAADRILLRSSPAVQSCRRLGLPDDYLYTLA